MSTMSTVAAIGDYLAMAIVIGLATIACLVRAPARS